MLNTLLRKTSRQEQELDVAQERFSRPQTRYDATYRTKSQLKGLVEVGRDKIFLLRSALFGTNIFPSLKPPIHHSTEQPGPGKDVQRRRSSAAAARGD